MILNYQFLNLLEILRVKVVTQQAKSLILNEGTSVNFIRKIVMESNGGFDVQQEFWVNNFKLMELV